MKVLVSDIDDNLRLNTGLISNIRNFIARGNLFIVATDKPINYVVDKISFLNLDIGYYICNSGAVIFDRYFNIVYRKDLKEDIVRPIMNILKDDNNILESFIDTSHGYVQKTDCCANGIVAHYYNEVKAEMTLSNLVLKYPSIHGQVSRQWINIVDVEVSKKNALEYLEQHYNLKKEDIYIIGKNISDLELMEQYNGYILENSSEDLSKYSHGKINNMNELINLLLKEEDDETIYA